MSIFARDRGRLRADRPALTPGNTRRRWLATLGAWAFAPGKATAAGSVDTGELVINGMITRATVAPPGAEVPGPSSIEGAEVVVIPMSRGHRLVLETIGPTEETVALLREIDEELGRRCARSKRAGLTPVASHPTITLRGEEARSLEELADRFLALAEVHAEREQASEDANAAYWRWHEDRECESSSNRVCTKDGCVERWREYTEISRHADEALEERHGVYHAIVNAARAAMGRAGVGEARTLREEFAGWCRPVASIRTPRRSFMVIGSTDFYESPYLESSGNSRDLEVVIL